MCDACILYFVCMIDCIDISSKNSLFFFLFAIYLYNVHILLYCMLMLFSLAVHHHQSQISNLILISHGDLKMAT